MSVVINGMEMPINCTHCPCSDDQTRFCNAAKKYIPMLGKPKFCPLETIEERKKGKWIERHHAYADEDKTIEEWQSCKCSICGRYDTRPYLYYFDEPRFCSWCGADMRGET